MKNYCKRLIEVDLPIKQIGEHARAEKNLRGGHPWHLHIWWARRPWGVCRSVALASILPDPGSPDCSVSFIQKIRTILSPIGYQPKSSSPKDLRDALLLFVGDSAKWELGSSPPYIAAMRSLLHDAFPDSPVLLDSFSGYGAIPGEALRLGFSSIALDLNPVAILILRTLLEAMPRHGQLLMEKFEEGAAFIKHECGKRLAPYYPRKNGKMPIAWLWARTVRCEGPGCGAIVPLISQTVLADGKNKVWIEIGGDPKAKTVSVDIKKGTTVPKNLIKTAGGGRAVCPIPGCGFTTPKESVKRQGKEGLMGHRLYGVAVPVGERQGKEYFNATDEDQKAFNAATKAWKELVHDGKATELTEKFPFHDPRAFTAGLYGISKWGDLFSERQKLALSTIAEVLREYADHLKKSGIDQTLIRDVCTALALAISNSIHYCTNMSTWLSEHMISAFITGNAIAMRWDWAEGNPLVPQYVGGLDYAFSQAKEGVAAINQMGKNTSTVLQADAAKIPLPDSSVDVFFIDPPYYDSVPYADLADLCYVWLKRFLREHHPDMFSSELTPKKEQIVVNPYGPEDGRGEQNAERYQVLMTQAFSEGKRVLRSDGIGVIVFAHKDTSAWEALLSAIYEAGFKITASWPIDTERAARMRANDSAALASSVHIVVRPRPNDAHIGDWREVLSELPKRLHEWMPRLRDEGIVGADAIFACLGPALEIYSRYSKVEKANGEEVLLKVYLEHVWAAVAKEALSMIFHGAEAVGFEEDARLTAMWLWTLSARQNGVMESGAEFADSEDNEDASSKSVKTSGLILEYDTARKIAQGLGVHLEQLINVVDVKGDKARLLTVSERANRLMSGSDSTPPVKRKKKAEQVTMSEILGGPEAQEKSNIAPFTETFKPGNTMLDRVHQSMILFASGRGDALKRFLVDDSIGSDAKFWQLAQSLSALYPKASEEKRWIDGVLARKKGLGF